MYQTTKINIQLLAILLVAAAVLVGLFILGGINTQMPIAAAQEPLTDLDAARRSFSKEILDQYGLSVDGIQAAAGPYNLQVTVNSNLANVPSGGNVIYTVTISNLGPNPAQYILFSQTLPQQMSQVNTSFNTAFISNGLNPPTWLLPTAIPNGGSVQVTISGKLTSQCNTSVAYIAKAVPFNGAEDNSLSNNTATRLVNITGGGTCVYLPIVNKNPTPTPNPVIFFDDFSGNHTWTTADDNDCDRAYVNNEYEIKAKTNNEDCFSPAPSAAEQKYGTVKVKVRRSEGSSNFTVALYINGSGADNYYAFEVYPDNDCGWRLIRRSGGSSSTKRSGGCDSAIHQDSGSNILEMRHFSNGDVSVFINGTQLGSTYNDGSQLGGRGTGVYARTNRDDDVVVKFDDFTVIQP